jgi:hypothetical protein
MKTPEQKKWTPPPRGIVEKQVDHMPKEVATEMLCRTRYSNRQRKEYMNARHRFFESDRKRAEPIVKLEKRLKGATWAQITKWETRALNHRAEIQAAYTLTERALKQARDAKPKDKQTTVAIGARIAVLERALAGLNMKAAQIDLFWDALDTEKGRRGLLIANLRQLKLDEMANRLAHATQNN